MNREQSELMQRAIKNYQARELQRLGLYDIARASDNLLIPLGDVKRIILEVM